MSGTERSLYGQALTAASAVILGTFVALFGQGIWSALITVNLATTPAIPWSVIVMAGVLWIFWQYLSGRWWPQSTSKERRLRLRANVIPIKEFVWSILAAALAVGALAGWWALIAGIEHISGSLLPADVSKYPRLTVALVVSMGSLISPVFEQAGFWGYCQARLEREFSAPTAILIPTLLFGLLPHPPMYVLWWPKTILFLCAGLTFSIVAYLTNSILPGLVVHTFSLLAFFTLVFRPGVGQTGGTAWASIHTVQIIGFALLSIAAFVHLWRFADRARRQIRR